MQKHKLISVIIPVYNVAGFLDRCLETIVSQSAKNLEIILVDDGSTDGSGDLCDKWMDADSRIQVLHTSNSGAAAARNAGLNIAMGEYIMFVDADDYLAEGIVEKLYAALNECDASCCMCGYIPVDEQGHTGNPVSVNCMAETTGMQALKDRYLHQKIAYNVVNPWGKLFKAEMWKDIRFTEGLYYEDMDIMPYLYHRCDRLVLIPEIGYYYFLRSGSASRGTGTDDKRYTDSVLIREKHISFYKSISEPDLAVCVTQMLIELIITSACNGWISAKERTYSKQIYRTYVKDLLTSPRILLKDKIRFLLFGIGGTRIYRRLVLK